MAAEEHLLSTVELSKTYGRKTVVKGVELSFASGEVIGLLGPNGAGKTTTFYMVVGLVPPTAGRITLDGQDITDMPMYQRARLGIAYLPQEPSVFRKMTVAQNLMSILEFTDLPPAERAERVEEALDELNIPQARSLSRLHALGGRAPQGRDRQGPGPLPQVLPSGRALRGDRPHRRGGYPGDHPAPEGARDWRRRTRTTTSGKR